MRTIIFWKVTSVFLVVALMILATACQANVGNSRGGDNDNDNTNINVNLDFNHDGVVDDADMAANCISCVLDKPEEQECSCLDKLGCQDKDLADCIECDGALALCLGDPIITTPIIDEPVDLTGGAI